MNTKVFFPCGGGSNLILGIGRENQISFLKTPVAVKFFSQNCQKNDIFVRSNLAIHHSDTPFVIQQPIHRPCLLERVCKPICTPHWCRLAEFATESTRDRV